MVEYLVFVLLLLLIAEGWPGWRGHRWRWLLPVSVAAPRHHRRGWQRGRRKVVGLKHALHLFLVHLLQLLELRQVLLSEAHEARRGRGRRGGRRTGVPGPWRGLRKRHRRRRQRDRRRRIVVAPAIPAPVRVHIGNEGAELVPAPLLVATDLQEQRR